MSEERSPLTPLERAILRAVVELGEDAESVWVRQRTDQIFGRAPTLYKIHCTIEELGQNGYLECEDRPAPETYSGMRRYWRPTFDLTEVLK